MPYLVKHGDTIYVGMLQVLSHSDLQKFETILSQVHRYTTTSNYHIQGFDRSICKDVLDNALPLVRFKPSSSLGILQEGERQVTCRGCRDHRCRYVRLCMAVSVGSIPSSRSPLDATRCNQMQPVILQVRQALVIVRSLISKLFRAVSDVLSHCRAPASQVVYSGVRRQETGNIYFETYGDCVKL